MIVLDKIKAFFKWYGKGMGFLEPKPEAKGAEKKAAEPPETKVATPEKKAAEPPETKVATPEKKANESSSK